MQIKSLPKSVRVTSKNTTITLHSEIWCLVSRKLHWFLRNRKYRQQLSVQLLITKMIDHFRPKKLDFASSRSFSRRSFWWVKLSATQNDRSFCWIIFSHWPAIILVNCFSQQAADHFQTIIFATRPVFQLTDHFQPIIVIGRICFSEPFLHTPEKQSSW